MGGVLLFAFAFSANLTFAAPQNAEYVSNTPTVYPPGGTVAQAVAFPDDGKFIQMGPGSEIILKFPGDYEAYPDGTSAADLRVDTFDIPYPAYAEVFVSLDGSAFISVGSFPDTANIDLDLTGAVKYVKIVQNGTIDQAYPLLGFDLDAVVALNAGSDGDGDGILDDDDNCPEIANSDQADFNKNDIGDACEMTGDGDGDGILNGADFCPKGTSDDSENDFSEAWGVHRWHYKEGMFIQQPNKKEKGTKEPRELSYTYGCSCKQILDYLKEEGLGEFGGHYKFGCSTSILDDFHNNLADGNPDGEYFIETVKVPGTNDLGIESAFNTVDGTKYNFEASGTYKFANWAPYGIADAKFNYRDAAHNSGTAGWVNGANWASPYANYLQVMANGGAIDWAEDYNSAHIYTAPFTGDGNTIHFNILDDAYGDNSGSIPVKIYADL